MSKEFEAAYSQWDYSDESYNQNARDRARHFWQAAIDAAAKEACYMCADNWPLVGGIHTHSSVNSEYLCRAAAIRRLGANDDA